MKAFAIIGTSALRKAPFVERLVEAYRLDDRSVSVVKRAPDGFDIDSPGKVSRARRDAGAREVMLASDRRMVLMSEYGRDPEPPLALLLARLAPVDVLIVEGFRDATLPTLEVHVAAAGREPRWAHSAHVVAIATNDPVEAPLPRFALDDIGAIADFMAERAASLRGA